MEEKILVDDGEDLKKYCPVYYIVKSNNIKHCYLCNKCVKDLGHHCYYFNKCISKKIELFMSFFLFAIF